MIRVIMLRVIESDTSDCVTSYGQVIVVMRDASEILALHARTIRTDCKETIEVL